LLDTYPGARAGGHELQEVLDISAGKGDQDRGEVRTVHHGVPDLPIVPEDRPRMVLGTAEEIRRICDGDGADVVDDHLMIEAQPSVQSDES
jgi:hypothetical protein